MLLMELFHTLQKLWRNEEVKKIYNREENTAVIKSRISTNISLDLSIFQSATKG